MVRLSAIRDFGDKFPKNYLAAVPLLGTASACELVLEADSRLAA